MAAAYSTGAALSRQHRTPAPQRVLICAAEDGAADTKRPRLWRRVPIFRKWPFWISCSTVRDSATSRWPTCRHWIALLSKHPGEFGLLVIDPIGSYLAGKDSHRDSDVRELLRPLGVLAEKHRIAVLLIAHLNKAACRPR